jgi:hypothetical protein
VNEPIHESDPDAACDAEFVGAEFARGHAASRPRTVSVSALRAGATPAPPRSVSWRADADDFARVVP